MPPLRHVIEVRNPVSQFDRVVKREQVAQRTKPYLLCPYERLSDQQVRGRARLPGSGEVFSDPRLVEAKRIKPLEIVEIPAEAIAYRSLRRVRRHQQSAELHLESPL